MSGGSRPETRYARSGDVSIAYQIVGRGPLDVVMVPGFPSHLELAWEQPRLAHLFRRLASFGRLILLDKRGVGLSDRVPVSELPGVEQRMDDLTAVLDAVGVERAALIGASDGGPLAAVFAATYPERAEALVVVNSYACRIRTEGYPWAPTAEDWNAFQEAIAERWGEPLFAEVLSPSVAKDPAFRDWWATFLRQSVSPGAATAILRMNAQIDIRSVLPAIHAPTLVLHRVGDRINPVGGARFIASQIPGARLVELPGEDHHVWIGDTEPVLAEIEAFLTGERREPAVDHVLATLLFTDIVGSTQTAAELGDRRWSALLETHHDVVRAELGRFGGREVTTTGDGFLAVFDGPARAIRCALAINDRLRDLGMRIRTGVHTSEIELAGEDVRGLGVHVAARVMALAGPGEVLVSGVVRDLALGSGLSFVERGEVELKGVPGRWLVWQASDDR
jgi:pimeloyl-ACP methyl ester carboxylesterase